MKVKHNLICFLFTSFLFGCGEEQYQMAASRRGPAPCTFKSSVSGSVDPDLYSTVMDFFRDAKAHRADYCPRLNGITMVDTVADMGYEPGSLVIGVCKWPRQINILRPYWYQASPTLRAALIYHELGHCLLNLDHSSPENINIMAPVILSEEILEDHWSALVDKLFARNYESL
ncbi:hypothetical protein UFOVP244_84 [uncultured Caudovirales phage]|uniref:Uncharacterized protein n=1 Tax=uncultured Caudovirales phage TaxID=2100421 RepID=A0A6J7X1G0_9CAUD|nr:hypothetical protein UFOVP244_84 [uncultured Caudovirales phage]